MITENSFFCAIDKRNKCNAIRDRKNFITTFSPYKIYQYSDSLLKHLPNDLLKKIENLLLYSKGPVYYNGTSLDKRIHNGDTSGFTTTGLNAVQLAILKKTMQTI